MGIFSFRTRISSGGNGAPPDDTIASDERSNDSKSGCSSIRQNWVGTPDHADTRCSAVSRRWVAGSHRPGGGKTNVLPNRAPVMNSGAVPEMWKNGVAQMDAGGGASGGGVTPFSSMLTVRLNAIADPMCTRLRWVSVAPFGRPVVPDVKRIMNGSSSSMATSGRSMSSPARAPACSTSVANGIIGTSASSMPTSANRSSRASSPNSTLGAVSSTPYASSGPVHHPLRPTMIPPRATVAHCANAYGEAVDARERDAVALRHAVLLGEHRRDRRRREPAARRR